MSHLTLLAPSSTSTLGPALAHDIRNAMAVIALHVETLESLAGPPGVKAASAAHPQGAECLAAACAARLQAEVRVNAAPAPAA